MCHVVLRIIRKSRANDDSQDRKHFSECFHLRLILHDAQTKKAFKNLSKKCVLPQS